MTVWLWFQGITGFIESWEVGIPSSVYWKSLQRIDIDSSFSVDAVHQWSYLGLDFLSWDFWLFIQSLIGLFRWAISAWVSFGNLCFWDSSKIRFVGMQLYFLTDSFLAICVLFNLLKFFCFASDFVLFFFILQGVSKDCEVLFQRLLSYFMVAIISQASLNIIN